MTETLPLAERLCVICNEGSGRNSREAEAVEAAMAVLGPRAVLWRVRGAEIARAAHAAVRQGFGGVVAAGGDGTVMAVADAVAGSGRRFGVVPLGTFNFFARGHGIPEDPAEAAALILRGRTRAVAVGEVNGKPFLNNASLGVYPAILRQREGIYRRWGRRRLAAHWASVRTFLRFQRPLYLTILADGEERRVRTPLLFAARSAYQLETFGLAGTDCVEKGRFAIFVAPDAGPAGMVHKAWRLVRRTMREGRDFDLICAAEATILTRSRHLTVACDGEKFRLRTPLRLRVRPAALEVFVPDEAEEARPEGAAA
ncbi:diacylglycerol kinase family protein [Rubellimicrobium sp. CFH 75288]|uniref:diacylglycerol/lipid kinase family protein n=1 Tax=Rubellimicrobium sp. CFH 75288 TaxID=2697034 RepID=UPI0014120121|nr:diacylglycerol kinase family protein [Rubellimicrobium sp. CFH 75288]NAZ37780.1 diacylglycerol kinase [Rubellimicrobium sp. CFH 75288]